MFNGFWPLESTTIGTVIVRDATGHPIDPDAPPSYRVYSPAGLMSGISGFLTTSDTGTVSNATNASPIVITSAGHNRVTGDYVKLSGVGGNTAANGLFVVTLVDPNTFSLDGSTGNGAFTTTGVWHQAGIYRYSILVGVANGFSVGQVYTVMINWLLSGVAYSDIQNFIVT